MYTEVPTGTENLQRKRTQRVEKYYVCHNCIAYIRLHVQQEKLHNHIIQNKL